MQTPPIVSALRGPAPAPVRGMVAIYLLMSAFHLGPWLRRAAP